jgi:DNA-binding CsgD family transcriptional regulator
LSSARSEPDEKFVATCAEYLRTFVRFDGLCLACAHPSRISLAQGHFHGLGDAETVRRMIESFNRVAHLDVITPRMLQTRGVGFTLDWDAPELAGEESAPFREHLQRFRILHGCGVFFFDEPTQNIVYVSPIRRREGDRFTSEEIGRFEGAAPLLAEALLIRRGNALPTEASPRVEQPALALVDRQGVFQHMTATFAELYGVEPAKSHAFSCLSEECLAALKEGRAWPLSGGQSSLYAVQDEDGMLLRIRPRSPVDVLSTRERQVAHAFARGDTYREIARCLFISPATVRRHLSNIYEKLDIGHRAELIALVAGDGGARETN